MTTSSDLSLVPRTCGVKRERTACPLSTTAGPGDKGRPALQYAACLHACTETHAIIFKNIKKSSVFDPNSYQQVKKKKKKTPFICLC